MSRSREQGKAKRLSQCARREAKLNREAWRDYLTPLLNVSPIAGGFNHAKHISEQSERNRNKRSR